MAQLVLIPQYPFRTTRTFERFPMISFSENNYPGIRLDRAFNDDLNGLDHPDSTPALTQTAKKVALRINWPGYPEWHDVIHAFDHRYDANPVTQRRLAYLVARKIQTCMQDISVHFMQSSAAINLQWRVENFRLEDLVLLQLVHVSPGSWQPVLAYHPRQF
ncbi:hypothetical protein BDW22DRAFT_626402 [Trametopsis cervina]|nr:hypothetical protein BDW22DRAFT_626402 [Trametopsis cervina]